MDTHIIDVASDRYHQVGEQITRLAARAAALASYSPTFGGVPDKSWNAFIANGYSGAASGTSDALRGAALAVTALADTSKQLSTLFTRTEQQNVLVVGQLAKALEGAAASESSSSSDPATSSRSDSPTATSRRELSAKETESPGAIRDAEVASGVAMRRAVKTSLPGVAPAEPEVASGVAMRRAVRTSLPGVAPAEPEVLAASEVASGVPLRRDVKTSLPGVAPSEPGAIKAAEVVSGVPLRRDVETSLPGVAVAPTESIASEFVSTTPSVTLPVQQPEADSPTAVREALAPTAVRDVETTPGSGDS